ncbi:MAG: 4-(cytidine 5'-diphospho)-2-C-methyl-D-erythritol kinase [Desulfobacterales bacterium]
MQTSQSYVRALSPAKINLFLKVTGKRADGYHNLHTLMCGITLFDTLLFEFDQSNIRLCCSHPGVPEDNTNLAWKAADVFLRNMDSGCGMKITIEKKIPVGAGLGGGSSNAATVLKVLNRYFGLKFSDDQLRDMGLEIGADVPFFISGRPAVAEGVGEKLQIVDHLKPFHVLLVNPGFSVSTATVYKNLNLGLTKCEKKTTKFSFEGISADIPEMLCNDLETVTAKMFPDIERAKSQLIQLGAEGALMSGSGPTVFGLFSDADQAGKAYREFNQFGEFNKFLAELIV